MYFFSRKTVQKFAKIKKVRIFAPQSANGALAHLARALDWQSKGDEFESRMLHYLEGCVIFTSFFYFTYKTIVSVVSDS